MIVRVSNENTVRDANLGKVSTEMADEKGYSMPKITTKLFQNNLYSSWVEIDLHAVSSAFYPNAVPNRGNASPKFRKCFSLHSACFQANLMYCNVASERTNIRVLFTLPFAVGLDISILRVPMAAAISPFMSSLRPPNP